MPRRPSSINEDMRRLAVRMNQLMDEWMHAKFRGDPDETWQPAVDVVECENGVCITADLAGMSRDEISVSVKGKSVTLSGVRRLSHLDKQMEVHVMELARGPFRRTLALPCETHPEKARISYRAGLLRVVVPKARSRE